MYALAIEGEVVLVGQAQEVLKNLKDIDERKRIEVASFQEGRGWVPLPLDLAHLA